MVDFSWILTLDKQSALGRGGISANYIIPQQQMNSFATKLRGERVWMILRGQEDRCLGVITVKKIERFSEGYHTGDFLITCDFNSSFRLSQNFETAKPYNVIGTQSLPLGINLIADDIADKLKVQISNTIQFKFAAPPDTMLVNVPLNRLHAKSTSSAKIALNHIVQKFALDEVWASGVGVKLGPFGNFAQRLLSSNGIESVTEITNFLKALDPLNILTLKPTPDNNSINPNNTSFSQKVVDLDFTEINPATVYAREYVVSNIEIPDLESALNKTEASEHIHQSMLRDISSFLKSESLLPYESGSVDLMIDHKDRTKIFEIKSSNPINIISQASKGAFQIACYLNAMMEDYDPLDSALILHKIEDDSLEKFTFAALQRLGVRYLVYNPANDWPNRVAGLLD